MSTDIKPEILLKAYIQYQSEEAFRELVASTLDEVYSASFRLVQGAPYLAEQITMKVFLELARNPPRLHKDLVLAVWLRERTCQMAVAILRAEDRPVHRAELKKLKDSLSTPASVQPAPVGLAIRVCHDISPNIARPKSLGLS